MKKLSLYLILSLSLCHIISGQKTDPWKPEQLLAPEILSKKISSGSIENLLIVDIGPAGLIKGAVKIGAVNNKENLKALKDLVKEKDKKTEIVLYCGCCPYANCPNKRPAFSLLSSMNFTNHKLLDLPRNLKVDWIDHGYPMD